jgi:PmbA protein
MLMVSNSSVRITNTLGMDAVRESRHAYSYIAPIAKAPDSDEVRDGISVHTGAEVMDTAGLAREAVEDAVSQLGATSVPSGNYRVMFKNLAAVDFLSAFMPMFSADNAQKGLSPLKNREGDAIAADCVSIIDDPLYPANPRAFDDEGSPSVTKTVVESGVFRTFLHNLKTAAKAGCVTTSNAHRSSAASPVGIAPSNLYVAPGEAGLNEMLKNMGDGLYITEVTGLHAGVNAVTGDFSLLSKGFLVEGGKLTRPVEQITIAGSFLTLLHDVVAVGSDLKFSPPGSTMLGSPSIYVRELVVAGK